MREKHTEEWRPVPGWESHYSVSNLGRVRREAPGQRTRPGAIVADFPKDTQRRYRFVNLSREDRMERAAVHRLVLRAFRPRQDARSRRLHVHHRNGDPADNRLENLEWVTPLGHARITQQLGQYRHGADHPKAKLNPDAVRTIRRRHRDVVKALASQYGVSTATIAQVLNGTTWRHVE